MWACAAVGASITPQAARVAAAVVRLMYVLPGFLGGVSSDRDPDRAAVLFEFGDPVGQLYLPCAAGAELGGAEDVVARPRGAHLQRQGADPLGGQLSLGD